jgi:glycerate kinase
MSAYRSLRSMRLLAATDKFRGTAGAREASEAVVAAAIAAGLDALALPLSDGGEGFLEAMGGTVRRNVVTGPLGAPVEAEWRLLNAGPGQTAVAVIEAAQAAGLLIAGGAARNDPERATTAGVGELLVAAWRAGARDLIVGCGGSASTDGGLGAVEAVLKAGGLPGARLRAAVDVQTLFLDAAEVFAPQKGADAAAVRRLARRLEGIAGRYLRERGVDVRQVPGSGAAGGLGGGLVALGGTIESGFDIVARTLDLATHLARADIVVSGEGRLDATSLEGKVVGGILRDVAPGTPLLVIAGDIAPGVDQAARAATKANLTLVSLVDRFGRDAAMGRTVELIRSVTTDYLESVVKDSR